MNLVKNIDFEMNYYVEKNSKFYLLNNILELSQKLYEFLTVLSSAPVQQEQHQYLSGPVTVPIQPSNIQNKGPGEHQTGTINYHLSFGNNNDSEQ
ncbi:unnamed protein product [Rotaria sp. Silwood2]|nr:unnamed protein product [Rotaria sp. Silwood2]